MNPFQFVIGKGSGLAVLAGNSQEDDTVASIVVVNVSQAPACVLGAFLEFQGEGGVHTLRIGPSLPVFQSGELREVFSVAQLHESLRNIPEDDAKKAYESILGADSVQLRLPAVLEGDDLLISIDLSVTTYDFWGNGSGSFRVNPPVTFETVRPEGNYFGH